jgi:hypothetical protein
MTFVPVGSSRQAIIQESHSISINLDNSRNRPGPRTRAENPKFAGLFAFSVAPLITKSPYKGAFSPANLAVPYAGPRISGLRGPRHRIPLNRAMACNRQKSHRSAGLPAEKWSLN